MRKLAMVLLTGLLAITVFAGCEEDSNKRLEESQEALGDTLAGIEDDIKKWDKGIEEAKPAISFETNLRANHGDFKLENFNKLETGMDFEEAMRVLDATYTGNQASANEFSCCYSGYGDDGAVMVFLSFYDGKLFSKTQTGLK